MAVRYMGVLISGNDSAHETKTTWRDIGDKVIFALGQFDRSESFNVNVSVA